MSRTRHRARDLRWRDLCPPATSRGADEATALRLGLLLAIGVLQAGAFVADRQPLPGDYLDHFAWLRRALAPLARRSPTIRIARRLLDLCGPRMRWDDHRTLRRDLRRLAAAADQLGRAQPEARP